MTFLHPALLWLLPLAAVPILLHLLTLHRLKTVELSTFRFLFDSYVQQRRKMQFLEALLAMLRTLFLLGLVMVFAGWVAKPLESWSGLFRSGGSRREVVLLVDCSASMNAKTAGVSAFDRAKAAAREVAQRLEPDDRLTLIRVTSRAEDVFSRFSSDPKAIEDQIEGLRTSPARGNIYAALMHVFGPEAPERTSPAVYLITDCQASGWKEVRNQGLVRLIRVDAQLIVVNVGSNEPVPNLAVIGDAPPRQPAIVGLPVYLRPRVVNHSRSTAEDVVVSVLIDEKEVVRATLTLKPGDRASKEVIYYPAEPGIHRGRFEIQGKSADRFPDDDSYLFTLNVVPRVKVVLVNGNPATDPYESETLHLKTALTGPELPATTSEGRQPPDRPPRSDPALSKDFARSLDVQEIPEGGLTPAIIQDASVVILANCGALNPTHLAWVRDFVRTGGGLLIFPGDRVNPDIYNQQLFQGPGPPAELLTPVRLGPPQGDAEKADTFDRLAMIDFSHPVLSVFDDPKARYFDSVRFYRRFPITPPEKKENFWPLAEFSQGTPALVESRFGEGTVLVAAFPAAANPNSAKLWTNLPLKPAFVPLVLRMVSHVQRRPEVEGPAVVPADSLAEIAVSENWGAVTGQVAGPANRFGTLKFERSGSRLLGAFEGTSERGYYSVEVKGGKAEEKRAVTSFAVNLAPEESELTTLGENQLRELLPTDRLTVVDASAEAQQLQTAAGREIPVWRWLIYLLFLLIGGEFLLATLGGRRKEVGEEMTVAERMRHYNPGAWVGRMTGGASTGTEEST